MIVDFDALLKKAEQGPPVRVAVVAADDEAALSAVLAAIDRGIAKAILYGDPQRITQLLPGRKIPVHATLDEVSDPRQAASRALQDIHDGNADILLKGKIKTADLLKCVLDKEKGLRTGRLLSDVFVFQNTGNGQNQLTLITDGGVNLKPDLLAKIEILNNAVHVAHALEITMPRVALLSAIETINSDLPSTIDAAILTKMNQRGQISGCIVDGPLALDNAVSATAAKIKGIESPVAGHADILLCPDIECANILAKSTTYFAGLRLAHVLVGAKVPVLIPSRSDSSDSKLLSIALGKLVHLYNTENGF
ncbi:bifunctional enoyl-CoA hydratase/phosphate acetyltransferase [candidate division KSB1 bacterium]|nr:bifunctional enoyl-CoA hydratase/phosphate acetyltransferase [candidate division KSB1 bacterium]